MEELVSIIMPAHNCQRLIGESIRSVVAQTYRDWELLVVDDCSTDDTARVVRNADDSRIRYSRLDKNSGAAAARNAALKQANGRYVAFLDADDMWKRDKLELQLRFMSEHNIGFSFSAYEIVKGSQTKVVNVPSRLNYSQFMKNTIIGTSTVVLDRRIIGDVEMVNVRQDHDSMTWAKILRQGHLAYGLNRSLAYYRKRAGSLSSDKLRAARIHWRNCRKIEGLSTPRCLYYFVFYSVNAVKKHYL